MRAKTTVAATLICLSMAGCFKAGRKAPLVENKPNARLVERYNEDLGKRLNQLQGDLMKSMERASEAKMELKRYRIFEKTYREHLEAKCDGIHDNNLVNLHGEAVVWRKAAMDEMNKVSEDVTNLITALQSEKLSIETTETEVGQPVVSDDNRGMVLSLMRLSMNLRKEMMWGTMNPLPAPECGTDEAIAAKEVQKDELRPEYDKVHGRGPERRGFKTELEPGLASKSAASRKDWGYGSTPEKCDEKGKPKHQWGYGSSPKNCPEKRKRSGEGQKGDVSPKPKAEEDIYDGEPGPKTNQKEIFEKRL